MYRFECVCGRSVDSTSVEGSCPHCERGFRLDWRAEYVPTPDTRVVEV